MLIPFFYWLLRFSYRRDIWFFLPLTFCLFTTRRQDSLSTAAIFPLDIHVSFSHEEMAFQRLLLSHGRAISYPRRPSRLRFSLSFWILNYSQNIFSRELHDVRTRDDDVKRRRFTSFLTPLSATNTSSIGVPNRRIISGCVVGRV